MKFYQSYKAYSPDIDCPPFPASVPGNVQLDYITAHPEFVSDINYGMEHKKMVELEPYTWFYRTNLMFDRRENEKIWFVTEGIDYIWSLILDGEEFYTHEGMFSRVDICLDDISQELFGKPLEPGVEFCIKIHPHPMLEGMPMDRNQASQSCKPPVAYEWDWHPRVIPSGLWDECYIESRDEFYIGRTEARYDLASDFSSAHLTITVEGKHEAEVTVYEPDGKICAKGTTFNGKVSFTISNPKLWWCRGYGEPNLYKYTVKIGENEKSGVIGFRRVQLTQNSGRFIEPTDFPKTRAYPPAQITLNGVNVFAKGSNYVNQEIFTGTMTREKYEELIKFAADANMNIFRCWGGTGCQKEDFYSLCDEYGIMLWFEFPLACNNYYDSDAYLSILKQEATAIILKLRSHPSISIWCGGNELFNSWSGMTDQHLALRLLNALTLELAPEIPYNPTSPIYGMKHGGYTFIDGTSGLDQFALFGRTEATAYTEFGIPSTPSVEYLRTFIPEDELYPPKPGGVWQAHHAFYAWNGEAQWLCLPTLERFGDISSIEAIVETSGWLQQMGYKAIFEEARRQKPVCAMAVNWCWCEPWKCAANNSLVAYPNVKKPGYFAVKDSLRDIVPSAKFAKFGWDRGEKFEFETWLLNDGTKSAKGRISAVAELNGVKYYLGFSDVESSANENAKGRCFSFDIPKDTAPKSKLKVTLEFVSDVGEVTENEYVMVVEK
ncbi:MAG: glycosyl hydrolase 2 galactose-binding domain-containing protein [Eubacteriales bacterium]